MTTPREDAQAMLAGMLREIKELGDEVERLRTELSKVSSNAADRAIECGQLYQERDEARRERDAIIAAQIKPWRDGKFAVYLARDNGGGILVEGWYPFDTYELAVAALRSAAGLDVPAADQGDQHDE